MGQFYIKIQIFDNAEFVFQREKSCLELYGGPFVKSGVYFPNLFQLHGVSFSQKWILSCYLSLSLGYLFFLVKENIYLYTIKNRWKIYQKRHMFQEKWEETYL